MIEALCTAHEAQWSVWQYALLVFGIIAGYGFVAGITHQLCERLKTDVDGQMLATMLWPVALPAIAGVALISWLTRPRVPRAVVVDRKESP